MRARLPRRPWRSLNGRSMLLIECKSGSKYLPMHMVGGKKFEVLFHGENSWQRPLYISHEGITLSSERAGNVWVGRSHARAIVF